MGAGLGWARSCPSVSGLMCLDDVSVCLFVFEHGHVWWGWERSGLSVSGFMCLHDVSVCHNLTGFLFLTSSTHEF